MDDTIFFQKDIFFLAQQQYTFMKKSNVIAELFQITDDMG